MIFSYDTGAETLGELWFLLFRRKRCPDCRGKLERADVLPDQGLEWERGWEGSTYRVDYVYKVRGKHRYRCEPCHAYYWLSELVERDSERGRA